MDKFEVVEKISKNIDYNSRNWNKEIIDRYLLKYDDKRIIESMTIIHLKDEIPNSMDHILHIFIQATCDGSENAVITSNPRNIAVLYRMEGSGMYCANT